MRRTLECLRAFAFVAAAYACASDDDASLDGGTTASDVPMTRWDAATLSSDGGHGSVETPTAPATVDAGGAGIQDAGAAPARHGVGCGEVMCLSPIDAMMGFMLACCLEADSGTCGVSFGGGACQPGFEVDPRCPRIEEATIELDGCCVDGMCGLEGSAIGVPCLELGEAARRYAGAEVVWPAPRACDASGDAGLPGQ